MQYRIEKDRQFWAVSKKTIPQKGERKGEEVWRMFKYCGTLEGAAKTLRDILIAEALPRVPVLDEIVDTVKELDKEVRKEVRRMGMK